jgi:hypothetical protein
LAPELSVGGDGTDGERDEDGGKRFHRDLENLIK